MRRKKVKSCFGTYGIRECISCFCNDSLKCMDCYFTWFSENNKVRRRKKRLTDNIKKYCDRHKLIRMKPKIKRRKDFEDGDMEMESARISKNNLQYSPE